MVMHRACTETQDTMTHSLIVAGTPTDQTVLCICQLTQVWPRTIDTCTVMQWGRIWRRQVSLGEKWSIAGEFGFNHLGGGLWFWSLSGLKLLLRLELSAFEGFIMVG